MGKDRDDIVVLLKLKNSPNKYSFEKHLVSVSQMLKEVSQGVVRIKSKHQKVL